MKSFILKNLGVGKILPFISLLKWKVGDGVLNVMYFGLRLKYIIKSEDEQMKFFKFKSWLRRFHNILTFDI